MAYKPANPNGQATMANSEPVVIASDQSAVPVEVDSLPLPTDASTETTLGTRLSESDFDTKSGSLTETAPATDTASSGLNGRLQRIAQRITSLITALGSPFQAGASIGNTSFAATQATASNLNMTEANSAAIKTSVESIDNAVSGAGFNISQINGVTPLMGNGATGTGSPRVTIANDNTPFSVKIDQTTPGTTNAVRNTAGTTGGATPYKLISAASTNATSVKASVATLYGIQVYNTNAAARYLKLYNKASAPTVGTDTPVKVITIPGSTIGAGSNVSIPSVGVAFGTGLAFALTTGAADSDTGAVAANEIITNLDYN